MVSLSTHIVEDVSELCTRMAIINGGEILLEAEPLRAIDDVRGRVWRKQVPKDDVGALEKELPVISTKMLAGRTFVNVFGEAPPDADFEAVEPDLKDVYFSVMGGHLRTRHRTAHTTPAAT